jgi:hypothetical protein
MKDEEIARLAKAQYEQEHLVAVRNGDALKFGERFFTFTQESLFDDRLRVFLPAEFADMPEDTAKIKYPGSERPKIIKSDERGAVCFTFNMIDSPLSDETVPVLATEMKTALQRLNPSWLFFDCDSLDRQEGGKTGFLEYKSPAVDDSVYNIMFFVPVSGITMMGTFSCPYGEYEPWQPVAAEILRLIQTAEKEEPDD